LLSAVVVAAVSTVAAAVAAVSKSRRLAFLLELITPFL
jgi:hypothetical protein